ncbi:MAG: VCBS repeat-containing protein [Acidimicrobiales bacterium]|nr:VCBS repeat-containing protein [Acidimicrobiales bacterium]
MRHRRLVAATAVAVASLAASIGAPLPGSAQEVATPPGGSDVPFGFTDGIPVGAWNAPVHDATPSGAAAGRAATGTRAVTTRYFGRGTWDGIRSAADAAARPCSVSTDSVTAMMLAPIFKEASAATYPSSAPAPMTLSRYDEWTGVRSDNTNMNANYGLYENRDPYTPYTRAYWHPGIGLWQYDDSGVGAPFTAFERMDTAIVGADVAKGMINRYCASSATDSFGKRRAAWSPWGDVCTTSNADANFCEIQYQAMLGGTTPFSNISLVDTVSETGGAIQRTCRIDSTTLPCWYVDPDRAEGSKGWTSNPTGSPGPTSGPAPLSYPFYVVKRNGNEERHWLRADTGYPVDISAVRVLGQNSRPRSNRPLSGLTWSRTSALCDLSASRGNCGTDPDPDPEPTSTLVAPSGVSSANLSVSGTYRTVILDADGNGRDDVLWYAPGTAADYLWTNQGGGRFTSTRVEVNSDYRFVVPIDVDGDGREDIVWYKPESGRAFLWRSIGGGRFDSYSFTPGAGLEPYALDLGGRGKESLFVYGAGTRAEAWWDWNGRAMARSEAPQVRGDYRVVVGDFDGNRRDDILWYSPGKSSDYLWLHKVAGGHLELKLAVGEDFTPLVGDFDGDRMDDIVWYQAGSTTDQVWWGAPVGAFTGDSFTVNSIYEPLVADVESDGRDDLLWYDPTDVAGNLWTRWNSDRGRQSVAVEWPGNYRPLGGDFGSNGGGVFWYGPGPVQDAVWGA